MIRFLKRRWLVSLIGLIAVTLAVPLAYRFYVRWQGQSRLAETIRLLDESDPGWTKDDLCKARNDRLPPPDRNSFTLVESVVTTMPAGLDSNYPFLDTIRERPANVQLRPGELDALKNHLAGAGDALAKSRALIDCPEGGRAVVIPEVPLDLDVEPIQKVRRVAWLLDCDSIIAAQENRGTDGIRNARATLGTARAIGDEPNSISQLVRSAMAAVACRTVERVLGLSAPADELAELQAELVREAEFPRLYHSFRAERASVHQMFQLLESGDINKLGGAGGVAGTGFGPLDRLSMMGLRTNLPDDHRYSLEMMTALVEAGRKPFDEQWPAVKAIPAPVDGDRRYLFTLLLTPANDKVAQSALRTRGELLAAAAAVACERHRQRTGRWPESLDAIPKDLLPAVPNDPFTGKPIRLVRLPDGLVIYSVGPDEKDDGGAVVGVVGNKVTDWGLRLWDPAERRSEPPMDHNDPNSRGPDDVGR